MDIRNREGERIDCALHGECDEKLVILAHGLTGDKDRELMVELAEKLANAGYAALRISYAGCGESEGEFGEATISKEVEDLGAILDQVKGQKKIAYVGYSMGAAVGALAAAKDDRLNVLVSLAGMVDTRGFVEREFSDVVAGEGCMWDEEEFPLSKKFWDDLVGIGTVIPAVKEHRIPWLMIHGSADDVVLPNDSVMLHNHVKGKKRHVVLDGADHSFVGHWENLGGEVVEWLNLHFK